METNNNLFKEAYNLKIKHRGPKVYFRGLIEISNVCAKNCLYCGIRKGNPCVDRYVLPDNQVMESARFAIDAGYGSIALQGGERQDSEWVERIARLIREIKGLGGTSQPLGITLSLGEQSSEVFRYWKQAGADRYLLRIEASDEQLYSKIHPSGTKNHSYSTRLQALYDLKSAGYLLGTGVMIGLPYQTRANLDNDLKFFKELEVDMVGMGPYIPHELTPLGKLVAQWKQNMESTEFRGDFWNLSDKQLLNLSLEMVARLRCLMPHINIAATTALQVLDPLGREKAIMAGANVIMPNITVTEAKRNYNLYEGKPGLQDDAQATKDFLLKNLESVGAVVGWNERGDWR